jgi:hypothetical protein
MSLLKDVSVFKKTVFCHANIYLTNFLHSPTELTNWTKPDETHPRGPLPLFPDRASNHPPLLSVIRNTSPFLSLATCLEDEEGSENIPVFWPGLVFPPIHASFSGIPGGILGLYPSHPKTRKF